MRKIAQFIFIILIINSGISGADQNQNIFSVKGFGTFAGTGTDTDKIGFRRNISSDNGVGSSWDIVTDSRLGIQIDAKVNEKLSGTFQWTARDRVGDFFEQNLDLAFLKWHVLPDLAIRFGRMSTDVFMLSDHRNVGYAYPWMRPPHEFYANIPLFHYDGVDITKKIALNDGFLSIKTFGGFTYNQLPIMGGDIFDQKAVVFSGSVEYEKGNWRSRLGYSHLDLISNPPLQQLYSAVKDPRLNAVWPSLDRLLPVLTVKDKVIHYGSIGVAYDDGLWLGQAEASYVGSDTVFFPDLASGYASVGRRFSDVTLYSLFGISKSIDKKVNIPNPLIPAPNLLGLRSQIDQSVNYNGVDEKSISLGLRWDFLSNMAFKAQWSHFWLGNNGTQNWIELEGQATPNEVNVFSVGVDFLY